MTTDSAALSRTISAIRRTAIGAILVSLCLSGAGCGPSIRRTEQSDNSFLRCFDMDYHPARTADEKEACWSAWIERRIYNQPADKVAYAELRLEEIGMGISVPGPPGPPGAFHERPVPDVIDPDAPVPENGGVEVAERPAAVDAGPASLPGDACAMACRDAFGACGARCAADAGVDCQRACEAGYSACMRSCFE